MSPKLVFVHIPKTGGASMCHTYPELRSTSDRPHHPPSIQKALTDDSIPFCVMRHPIDRILSLYRMIGKDDDPWALNDQIAEWMNISPDEPIYNLIRPQVDFTRFCKHILRFTHLEEDLHKLLEQHNIPIQPFKHMNKGKDMPRVNRKNISPANLKALNQFYKEDFELWETIDK